MATTPFSEAAERVASGGDPHAEAEALVSALTLDELFGMLDGDVPFANGLVDISTGGYHEHPWPAARVERLGIPGLLFSDGPRGVVIGSATCFPVSMARGASFDLELEEAIGDAIGIELRASGATYFGGVCINLLRHPGWGRAQETYGEDPLHVGAFGASLTRGVQRHAMACVKHYALNSMENARFTVDVVADERALHEVYLPHFRQVIDEGVASVMSSYNSVNGEWTGQSHHLLTEILRDDWGFEGFVITDFIFGLRDPVQSVRAGLDIEMPFRQQRAVALPIAIEDGTLSRADLEAPARRIVATLLRFAPILDRPRPPVELICCDEHRHLARRAATESMVMLRNEDSLLPLDADRLETVALVGSLAAVPNLGDGGSSDVSAAHTVTPLDGLRAALPGVDVRHSDDHSAALEADAVIVVVGFTKDDEGEFIDDSGQLDALASLMPSRDDPSVGQSIPLPPFDPPHQPFIGSEGMSRGGDRRSLRLSADDEALIAATIDANPNTVVAVMGGSATVMPWIDDVPSVLLIWYPGQEGGHALADLVLGRVAPSGRLPFAIPRDENDLVRFDPDASTETYGVLHGQWWLDANDIEPHFPFGFGLGYTTIEIVEARATGPSTVEVELANTGERDGVHVVQIYGSVPTSAHLRPARRLIGFARAAVNAGRSLIVDVPIRLDTLEVRVDGAFVSEAAPIAVVAASHAGDSGVPVLGLPNS